MEDDRMKARAAQIKAHAAVMRQKKMKALARVKDAKSETELSNGIPEYEHLPPSENAPEEPKQAPPPVEVKPEIFDLMRKFSAPPTEAHGDGEDSQGKAKPDEERKLKKSDNMRQEDESERTGDNESMDDVLKELLTVCAKLSVTSASNVLEMARFELQREAEAKQKQQVGAEKIVNASLSPGGKCLPWCLTSPFKHGMTWGHRCHDHECQGCDTCRKPLHENSTRQDASDGVLPPAATVSKKEEGGQGGEAKPTDRDADLNKAQEEAKLRQVSREEESATRNEIEELAKCSEDGMECCESQNLTAKLCSAVPCCAFQAGQCWSAVGTATCKRRNECEMQQLDLHDRVLAQEQLVNATGQELRVSGPLEVLTKIEAAAKIPAWRYSRPIRKFLQHSFQPKPVIFYDVHMSAAYAQMFVTSALLPQKDAITAHVYDCSKKARLKLARRREMHNEAESVRHQEDVHADEDEDDDGDEDMNPNEDEDEALGLSVADEVDEAAKSVVGSFADKLKTESPSAATNCMAWCLTAPFKNGRTWSHRCRDDECRGCDTCRAPQNATKKEARVSKRKARREAKTEAFKAKEEHKEARHNKEATWGLSGGGWRTVDKDNETAVQEENEAATESKTEEKKAHKKWKGKWSRKGRKKHEKSHSRDEDTWSLEGDAAQ